jgi:hypothetical protein
MKPPLPTDAYKEFDAEDWEAEAELLRAIKRCTTTSRMSSTPT